MSNDAESQEGIAAKVYPEQETPPRPTYYANIRGNEVGGWLHYSDAEGMVAITITVNGTEHLTEEFPQRAGIGRSRAKNVWRLTALQAVLGV